VTRIVVRLRAWEPGRLPEILLACGAERLPDKVIPQLRIAVALSSDDRADAVLAAANAHPEIEHAYRNVRLERSAEHLVASNDALLDECWHLKRVGAFQAHKITTGSPEIKQAVIDCGYDAHPDVDPIAAGNGYSTGQDLPDPQNPDQYVFPGTNLKYSHGLWVQSYMAGRRNNGIGVAGVAPGCPVVMVSEYAPDDGTGGEVGDNLVDALEAFVWATDAGARVINASLAFADNNPGPHTDTEAALQYAWDHGALVFLAAGNNGVVLDTATNPRFFLQESGEATQVTVGNTQHNDSPRPASNYGPLVELCAPGTYCLAPSLGPLNEPVYHYATGTSFSSPITAAVASLVLSVNPALTNAQVRALLLDTADESFDPTFAARFPNAGMVNAAKAVTKALATLSPAVLASRFPARAGQTVFPCAGFWKAPPYASLPSVWDEPTSAWLPITEGPWSLISVSGGVATTTLDGPISIDLTGYASGDEVDAVELWVGESLIYRGPPARIATTASSGGPPQQVKVVVHAGAVSAEETYSDVVVASMAVVGVPAPGPLVDADLPAAWALDAAGGSFRLIADAASRNGGSAPLLFEGVQVGTIQWWGDLDEEEEDPMPASTASAPTTVACVTTEYRRLDPAPLENRTRVTVCTPDGGAGRLGVVFSTSDVPPVVGTVPQHVLAADADALPPGLGAITEAIRVYAKAIDADTSPGVGQFGLPVVP